MPKCLSHGSAPRLALGVLKSAIHAVPKSANSVVLESANDDVLRVASRNGQQAIHIRLRRHGPVIGRSESQLTGVRQRLELAENEGLEPVADLALKRWFTPQWRASHPAEAESVRQRLLTTDHAGYLKAYRLFVDSDALASASAPDIEALTLVLAGERDSGSTPEMAVALADAIPAGEARIMPGVHHLAPIEQPNLFSNALLEFLNQENPS